MLLSIIAILTTLLVNVLGAAYPRQSSPACGSYECPVIPNFTFKEYTNRGPFFNCSYESPDGDIGCVYIDASGALFENGNTPAECPSTAACVPIPRRKRNSLPVAPPRTAPRQSLPSSLMMRGQLRKRREY